MMSVKMITMKPQDGSDCEDGLPGARWQPPRPGFTLFQSESELSSKPGDLVQEQPENRPLLHDHRRPL